MTNHNKIAADEFCNKTHTSPIEAYVANRISLADADIANDVGFNLSMSDADINLIQHKVHTFMESL